ncbi:hypothetical protein AQUCO_01900010v1 [Aquilegia coerulea]|uniref:F-box/LRR-repeat protein 15/At3g58940/PEG3-like LRR domain-containing protein n=1 Tax=Aquilegia coerulea TaxID=218851 RepID=A0A2G5DIP8_AQUCA|nr:hypothetical protein AQUCO_01900010v1 [Aquilegia coerulea]
MSIHASPKVNSKYSDLVKSVNDVLLLHKGMISKFEMNNFLSYGCSDRWILVVSKTKMLNHLVLAFHEDLSSYQVPFSLFNCEALKSLRFDWCKLRLSSQYDGFSSLTELEMCYLTLTDETLKTFIAKIPRLKALKVIHCQSLKDIVIHAPNLEVVKIEGINESVNFQNTPNLRDMKVWLCKRTCRLDTVLGGLHELQVVNLRYPSMEAFPGRLHHHLSPSKVCGP